MGEEVGQTAKESEEGLLDIYKLHVEMADRVSQRREGANRLFVTLLSAMTVLMAAVLRFGPELEIIPVKFVILILVAAVLALAGSWYIVILAPGISSFGLTVS